MVHCNGYRPMTQLAQMYTVQVKCCTIWYTPRTIKSGSTERQKSHAEQPLNVQHHRFASKSTKELACRKHVNAELQLKAQSSSLLQS